MDRLFTVFKLAQQLYNYEEKKAKSVELISKNTILCSDWTTQLLWIIYITFFFFYSFKRGEDIICLDT